MEKTFKQQSINPESASNKQATAITQNLAEQRRDLILVTSRVAARGWFPATSGNFSLKVQGSPLRMLMSPSRADKGQLNAEDLIVVSGEGDVISSNAQPSAEALLHSAIYQNTAAQSVLHVHTVWNTLVSEQFESAGAVNLSGYEMLKALNGISTHEHRERVAIFPNSQDMDALAKSVSKDLQEHPKSNAFLLSGHGIYTWGDSPDSAYRHLEALEFLFEVIVRKGRMS